MRVLLISDVHANLEALEACLSAAPEHDQIVNLGDIVGYGASPNEVSELSRELGGLVVRGNHDKACSGLTDPTDFNPVAGLAVLWTRQQLHADNLEWLRQLPQGPLKIAGLMEAQFVHGSPLDEDEYVVSEEDAIEPLLTAEVPVTFFGHTHIQGIFESNPQGSDFFRPEYATVGQSEHCEFPLEENLFYMVNPGSVGQPRDGDWRAAFALYNSPTRTVTFYRVPYKLKEAQDRILAASLPQRLATRLAAGR